MGRAWQRGAAGVVGCLATSATPGVLATVTAELEEASCIAGGPCTSVQAPGLVTHRDHHYYWPHTRGRVGHYSASPFRGPHNLSASLDWVWHHPAGRSGTVINGGPLIDGDKNLYLMSVDAIRKFSPDGRTLWTYMMKDAMFHHNPSIVDGALYGTNGAGFVFSLDMATGLERWNMQAANLSCGEISSVSAHSGIVLAAVGVGPMGRVGGCQKLVAVNATDGQQLWDFIPNAQLWNFVPMFTDFGTFVFQDQIGGVYHLRLNDSGVLWTSGLKGSWTETWCDGGTTLGPNGIVYSVNAAGPLSELVPDLPGSLRAYRLADGELLWRRDFQHPPNSWPVVGRLSEGARLAVVLPVGAQAALPKVVEAGLLGLAFGTLGLVLGWVCGTALAFGRYLRRKRCTWCAALARALALMLAGTALGVCTILLKATRLYHAQVWAFDAETGDILWRWDLPPWQRNDVRGDSELLFERIWHGTTPLCLPNPFASATLDAAGAIYTGYMNGMIYRIRDENGDSEINDEEVDEFDAGAAFSHPGVAMASGMLAIASCDTLHVFHS